MEYRTITGKPVTTTLSFQVPLCDYERVLELADRQTMTLSEAARRLLRIGLRKASEAQEGGREDAG